MGGVFEALIATAFGLFVAIPAVIAFNIFQRKVRETLAQTDSLAHQILASIRYDKKPASPRRPARATVDRIIRTPNLRSRKFRRCHHGRISFRVWR